MNLGVNFERILFGLPTLIFSFSVIALDAWGKIDIGKFGYAAFGTWITLLINFYYRKGRTEQ